MRRPSAHTLMSLVAIASILLGTLGTFLVEDVRDANVLDLVLLVTASAGTLARRRYPVAALIIVGVSVAVYYPESRFDGPIAILVFIVLFTAADQGQLIAAVAMGSTLMLAMGYGEARGVGHVDDTLFVAIAGWVVASIAFGGVTRNRRAYLEEAERRALEAEHSKEEEARRRASEERLRIARELHDVLGHNISMINVQAAAALHGLKKRPEDAEQALRTIKDASKETLRELRITLGVLRQVDEGAPTAPADSLARVDALVAASGLEVTTELSGPLDTVPAEADLAASRIIREALTNVSRHSGTNQATLTISSTSGNIMIRVEDDGPGATFDGGTGFGLQGMRERAAALGGSLEAGPRPEGGFRVVVHLPLNGAS
ncbi:sensor histidine kinase [Nonomuraea typhae]|uniref:Oxygen sensor histidine kinase NreB n=1 Tax=Nonomuraea typhae TaxID=2603600 RepID=A0ABW7Z9B9_9ACTN